MAKRIIGQSISEAIDWTQDMMSSTRPIAESILFTMLRQKKIAEGSDGFVLFEADEDDEDQKNLKVKKHMGLAKQVYHRPRFTFGTHRKGFADRHSMMKQRLQAMGYSEEAEEMHYGTRQTLFSDGPITSQTQSLPVNPKANTRVKRERMPPGWVI